MLVLGICGGSGSGKSTLATACATHFADGDVAVLPFDSYYRDLRHLSHEDRRALNFDHPDALDVDLYGDHIDALRRGEPVGVPVYDFANHTRTGETVMVAPAPLVVAEGILLLSVTSIATRLDYSVFLDVPEDVRFERRLARDTVERGRHEGDVRQQFFESVAPMHDEFVQPNGRRADAVEAHPWDVMGLSSRLVATVETVIPA